MKTDKNLRIYLKKENWDIINNEVTPLFYKYSEEFEKINKNIGMVNSDNSEVLYSDEEIFEKVYKISEPYICFGNFTTKNSTDIDIKTVEQAKNILLSKFQGLWGKIVRDLYFLNINEVLKDYESMDDKQKNELSKQENFEVFCKFMNIQSSFYKNLRLALLWSFNRMALCLSGCYLPDTISEEDDISFVFNGIYLKNSLKYLDDSLNGFESVCHSFLLPDRDIYFNYKNISKIMEVKKYFERNFPYYEIYCDFKLNEGTEEIDFKNNLVIITHQGIFIFEVKVDDSVSLLFTKDGGEFYKKNINEKWIEEKNPCLLQLNERAQKLRIFLIKNGAINENEVSAIIPSVLIVNDKCTISNQSATDIVKLNGIISKINSNHGLMLTKDEMNNVSSLIRKKSIFNVKKSYDKGNEYCFINMHEVNTILEKMISDFLEKKSLLLNTIAYSGKYNYEIDGVIVDQNKKKKNNLSIIYVFIVVMLFAILFMFAN